MDNVNNPNKHSFPNDQDKERTLLELMGPKLSNSEKMSLREKELSYKALQDYYQQKEEQKEIKDKNVNTIKDNEEISTIKPVTAGNENQLYFKSIKSAKKKKINKTSNKTNNNSKYQNEQNVKSYTDNIIEAKSTKELTDNLITNINQNNSNASLINNDIINPQKLLIQKNEDISEFYTEHIFPNQQKSLNNNNISLLNICQNSNIQEDKKATIKESGIFKENYLDILITAAESLINHYNIPSDYFSGNQSSLIKCKNKICMNFIKDFSISIYCKECDIEFQNGNYCVYCKLIYKTPDISSEWIQCSHCYKYQHIQCEEENGNLSNLTKLISSPKTFKYLCMICKKCQRINTNSLKKLKKGNQLKNINKKTISFYKNKIKSKPDKKDILLDLIKILEIDNKNKSYINNNHHSNYFPRPSNKRKNKKKIQ